MLLRPWLTLFTRIFGIANYQADLGGDDPDAGRFATVATRRVAAATKLQFQTIALAASRKRRQKLDELSSLANTTGGKLRRIASESMIGRRLALEVWEEK